MQRRGLVLAFLMRLKQICNHPVAVARRRRLRAASDSGKFARLREIAEEIAARQEKVLVFTQFREMTEPLAAFLGRRVRPARAGAARRDARCKQRKRPGRALPGRRARPFFVLSLKAGGTGLNLTAASHVIHFDRWWNPAVENQATDRAFRIGQKRNVLVHKFVCRGTVEEKIDADDRRQARGGGRAARERPGEVLLTEMSDIDLLRTVSIDLDRALEEAA